MNLTTPLISLALAIQIAIARPGAAEEHHDEEAHGEEAQREEVRGDETHSADTHEEEHAPQFVKLTTAEREEFGIEVSVAGPAPLELGVTLPGEVRPNADRVAHIVPRYSGIVTDVRANLGDRVERGQVMAIVESDESLAPFEVKTLISGTVITKHVTLGEPVSRDHGIFEIADLSTVWIDLTVYQRDLGRTRTGQKARISTGDALSATGTISYVTPTVDERTRTATARVVLPNPDGAWRPGMFVTGTIVIETVEVPVAVPRAALHAMDGRTVVFVETEKGFTPRPVELGRAGDGLVEIASGLETGTRYVSAGGFTLKAELGKESFGDGHAH